MRLFFAFNVMQTRWGTGLILLRFEDNPTFRWSEYLRLNKQSSETERLNTIYSKIPLAAEQVGQTVCVLECLGRQAMPSPLPPLGLEQFLALHKGGP